MAVDDDADCVEHVWELQGVTFAADGATENYACTRCPAVELRQPTVVRRPGAAGT